MTMYNATIELHAPADAVHGLELVDALSGYHPAAGASQRGRLEVTVSLPAETLRQACTTALAVVEAAAGVQALTVEVMPTAEHDERLGIEALPEVVGVTEAAAILGVSRQRVLQLVEAGTLPHQRAGNAVVISRAAVLKRAAAQ